MSKNSLPHDAFFKHSMSIQEVAQEYFQMHLPENVKNLMDFSTLKMEPDSFVDEALKKSLSDVLFSCKTTSGTSAFLYLLCEEQSTPDYWMSLRIFKYIFAIADKYLKQNPKSRTIPLIYPMVFYNGRKKHNTPRSLHKLFEHSEIAAKVLYEDYPLIDANKLDDEDLKKKYWAGTMQFFMKHAFERNFIGLLEQSINALQKVGCTSHGLNFLYSILCYNKDKIFDKDEKNLKQVLTSITNQKKVENIMGTLAEKYVKIGKTEGRQEGRQEGREKLKYEIAIKMLLKGCVIEEISDLTDLNERQILLLKESLS